MRATRYLLKAVDHNRLNPVPARAAAVVCLGPSIRLLALLNGQLASSRSNDSGLIRTLSNCTPAYTEACSQSRNGTKRRLNLHTRPAPPAASF
jgi:hypothetical protein